MSEKISRREFMSTSSSVVLGSMLSGAAISPSSLGTRKGPYDYIIVQGHRDIYEFNERFNNLRQESPLRDHMLRRFLSGGLDVIVMPVGGTAPRHRAGNNKMLEGTLQVIDMLITEIKKTGGHASILKSKADIPAQPDKNKVLFFFDIEGAEPITVNHETDVFPARRLALLRDFYRLGVRGIQLTHNGRNLVADGIGEGDNGGNLSKFGVEVVQEMNRLGMMIGVSHLSATCLRHVAEISTAPIVSTHTNMNKYIDTPRQHTDEELKTIASTGGLVAIRYIPEKTSYELLIDEIAYMSDLVGVEHTGMGWLGHDRGDVYAYDENPPSTGVESQTMYEQWNNLIRLLEKRGFTDHEISLVMGGNFLRVWNHILS